MNKVEEQFAATGMLNCPWINATANLIEKADLIVTNAHVLFDANGKQKGRLNQCRFVVRVGAITQTVGLSSDYAAGHSKSRKRNLQTKDWLVVKLKRKLSDITPYSTVYPENPLASKNATSSKKVWNVTVVAARNEDWPINNGKVVPNVKSIGDCKVRDVSWPKLKISFKGVRAIRSDCDSGPGSSGGAYLFKRSGKYFIVGLITGLSLDAKIGRHGYKFGKHDAWGVLLSGAFLETVQSMTLGMGIREIQQALLDLGFNPGPVDGKMGKKTRLAIRAFQKQSGLPDSGKITPGMVEKLSKSLNE